MDTFACTPTCRVSAIALTTDHPTEFIDLTARVQAVIADSAIERGFVNIQTLHTTSAIVVNEAEPRLLGDFAALLEQLAPLNRHYRHDDLMARTANITAGERVNGHAHCRALLLPSSATLNVVDGALVLGTWQRVFLVELDGPRVRHLSVAIVGEGRR
jgi:secondary thiamine-phosphate synthase enzyme